SHDAEPAGPGRLRDVFLAERACRWQDGQWHGRNRGCGRVVHGKPLRVWRLELDLFYSWVYFLLESNLLTIEERDLMGNVPAPAPGSPWPRREERARERELKRDAVLRTAVALFNKNGVRATSLAGVAKALNVTKPTIYHYFSTKDEILFECVRRGV